MLDNKGSFYIIDAIFAVVLILVVFLALNSAISIPTPEYSYESKDIKTANDIMEILGGKVNFEDRTFISKISEILKEGENSKKSVSEVSEICENKFEEFNLENYKFSENNKLRGKVLVSSGDYKNAQDVSVASRTYGDYSYTLYIW